jgi:hypothetical protein
MNWPCGGQRWAFAKPSADLERLEQDVLNLNESLKLAASDVEAGTGRSQAAEEAGRQGYDFPERCWIKPIVNISPAGNAFRPWKTNWP